MRNTLKCIHFWTQYTEQLSEKVDDLLEQSWGRTVEFVCSQGRAAVLHLRALQPSARTPDSNQFNLLQYKLKWTYTKMANRNYYETISIQTKKQRSRHQTELSNCCNGRLWLKSRPEFKTVKMRYSEVISLLAVSRPISYFTERIANHDTRHSTVWQYLQWHARQRPLPKWWARTWGGQRRIQDLLMKEGRSFMSRCYKQAIAEGRSTTRGSGMLTPEIVEILFENKQDRERKAWNANPVWLLESTVVSNIFTKRLYSIYLYTFCTLILSRLSQYTSIILTLLLTLYGLTGKKLPPGRPRA